MAPSLAASGRPDWVIRYYVSGSRTSGSPFSTNPAGLGRIAADAAGISGNLRVINPSSSGYAFIAPTISGTPTSSTVNTTTGLTVANGLDVALSAGKVSVEWVGTKGSRANISLDVTGYWK
jgi:hypothetical protein